MRDTDIKAPEAENVFGSRLLDVQWIEWPNVPLSGTLQC